MDRHSLLSLSLDAHCVGAQVLKEAYDFAAAEADEANRVLRKTQAMERAAADEITEDHVIATDLGRKLHDIFPTLRTGYLVGRQKVELIVLTIECLAESNCDLRNGLLKIGGMHALRCMHGFRP